VLAGCATLLTEAGSTVRAEAASAGNLLTAVPEAVFAAAGALGFECALGGTFATGVALLMAVASG